MEPGDEEVKLVMQLTLEGIKAQERDPWTAYANRVRELNYGNSYYFKVLTVLLIGCRVLSIFASIYIVSGLFLGLEFWTHTSRQIVRVLCDILTQCKKVS